MLGLFGRGKLDHPLADPKAARKLIAEIPANDAFKALGEIGFWLDSVIRADGFRVDRRYELLDLLDQAAKNHQRKLSQDYLLLRQQKFQEHRVWTAVSDFWRLVGAGYAQCIEGFQAGAPGAGALKTQVPAICCRALRALTLQLKWSLLRYGPLEDRLWGSIGQVYGFAEAKGLASTGVAMYPGAHGASSPRKEFLKSVMLAAASTDSLLPNQIEIAERTVAHFCAQFSVNAQRSADATHAYDLAMRKPPSRLHSDTSGGDSIRYLGASTVVAELSRLSGILLKEGALPSSADMNLGGEHESQVILDTWRHLMQYWSPQAPARSAERSSSNARLTVVHGLPELLKAIDGGAGDDSLDFSSGAAAESESWVAENVSEGGYGAVVSAQKGDWLKVGALVGVRSNDNTNWGAGIVRRISRDTSQNMHVGIQLLTPAAIPARLAPVGTSSSFNATREPEPGVLLSTKPDANQQIRVLLRTGGFAPTQPLEMQVRGKTYAIMPVRLAEGTDQYDVGRFKLLQRVA